MKKCENIRRTIIQQIKSITARNVKIRLTSDIILCLFSPRPFMINPSRRSHCSSNTNNFQFICKNYSAHTIVNHFAAVFAHQPRLLVTYIGIVGLFSFFFWFLRSLIFMSNYKFVLLFFCSSFVVFLAK